MPVPQGANEWDRQTEGQWIKQSRNLKKLIEETAEQYSDALGGKAQAETGSGGNEPRDSYKQSTSTGQPTFLDGDGKVL